jgi:hypothetical protein
MRINELIVLMNNNLESLRSLKVRYSAVGDVGKCIEIDSEIDETVLIIYKLQRTD